MKRCIAVLAATILMINLAACGKSEKHSAYKEIYKRYNHMESYYAEAEITSRNDRSENVYYVRQFYKAPDMYSMVVDGPEEIAGSGYVFKNGEVKIKSGFGKSENLGMYSPNERGSSCISDFFAEYYKSEETMVSVTGGIAGNATTVLNCQLSGKNVNLFSQSLWINNKTFLPIKLETYDVNNNVVVTVEYNEFKLNCDLDDAFFE